MTTPRALPATGAQQGYAPLTLRYTLRPRQPPGPTRAHHRPPLTPSTLTPAPYTRLTLATLRTPTQGEAPPATSTTGLRSLTLTHTTTTAPPGPASGQGNHTPTPVHTMPTHCHHLPTPQTQQGAGTRRSERSERSRYLWWATIPGTATSSMHPSGVNSSPNPTRTVTSSSSSWTPYPCGWVTPVVQ